MISHLVPKCHDLLLMSATGAGGESRTHMFFYLVSMWSLSLYHTRHFADHWRCESKRERNDSASCNSQACEEGRQLNYAGVKHFVMGGYVVLWGEHDWKEIALWSGIIIISVLLLKMNLSRVKQPKIAELEFLPKIVLLESSYSCVITVTFHFIWDVRSGILESACAVSWEVVVCFQEFCKSFDVMLNLKSAIVGVIYTIEIGVHYKSSFFLPQRAGG